MSEHTLDSRHRVVEAVPEATPLLLHCCHRYRSHRVLLPLCHFAPTPPSPSHHLTELTFYHPHFLSHFVFLSRWSSQDPKCLDNSSVLYLYIHTACLGSPVLFVIYKTSYTVHTILEDSGTTKPFWSCIKKVQNIMVSRTPPVGRLNILKFMSILSVARRERLSKRVDLSFANDDTARWIASPYFFPNRFAFRWIWNSCVVEFLRSL